MGYDGEKDQPAPSLAAKLTVCIFKQHDFSFNVTTEKVLRLHVKTNQCLRPS